MPSSTASREDSTAIVRDLYILVISELKKASLICLAINAAPNLNPVVFMEVPDGTNSRGKCIIC